MAPDQEKTDGMRSGTHHLRDRPSVTFSSKLGNGLPFCAFMPEAREKKGTFSGWH